jgi:ADP-heptose:LPS heptosyltransferase
MMKKILIIRFSSIGDIVLTTPVIRCLKKQLPETEIHFLTRKSFAAVLKANPYIDKLHLLDKDLPGMIRTLRAERFDQIIDLHHNVRSARIKWKLNIPAHSFPKLNIEKWLYVRFKWNRMPAVHIVDRYLETVQPLGIKKDEEGLDYYISPEDELPARSLPYPAYIGLVIGAAHATKRLPLHKLQELVKNLTAPVVLLGGKEDRDNGTAIAAIAPERIVNACGQYNLNQSASLVRQAKLIITHDTGLMHIAAAFDKPILSVWGNTVPAFGMYPYRPGGNAQNHQFEVKNLACRPCSKIGFEKCPKGHFKCMVQQDMHQLAAMAMQLWHNKKP